MIVPATLLLAAAQAATPAPATAAPATQPATEVDPARLTAARRVVDQFFPPDRRDTMVEAMLAPTFATMRQSFVEAPEMATVFGNDPAFKTRLDAFMAEEQARSMRLLRTSLPQMLEAMARAYARRFTVAQLDEIAAFFRTPTGSLYVTQSMTLMSDPDVQASQRAMMAEAMKDMPQRIQKFAREAATAAGAEPTP